MKKKLKIITSSLLTLLSSTPSYARISNPVAPTYSTGAPGEALAMMIANIWKTLVIVGSIFFVLYFAWGAVRWVTAQGDKSKFEEGRDKIANGAIGLVILVASVAIIQFLGSVLNIQFLEDLSFDFPGP